MRRVTAAQSAARRRRRGSLKTRCAARRGKTAPRSGSSGPLSGGNSGVSSMQGGRARPADRCYRRWPTCRSTAPRPMTTPSPPPTRWSRSSGPPSVLGPSTGWGWSTRSSSIRPRIHRAGPVRGSARHPHPARAARAAGLHALPRRPRRSSHRADRRRAHALARARGPAGALRLPVSDRAGGTRREPRPLAEMNEAAAGLGLKVIALGYRPFDQRDGCRGCPRSGTDDAAELPVSGGSMALDMMLMTCHRAGLDRLGLRGGLRAQGDERRRASRRCWSRFRQQRTGQGPADGYLSWRSRVWSDVDKARCGYSAHAGRHLQLPRLRGVGAEGAAAVPPAEWRLPAADLTFGELLGTGSRAPARGWGTGGPRCPRSSPRCVSSG